MKKSNTLSRRVGMLAAAVIGLALTPAQVQSDTRVTVDLSHRAADGDASLDRRATKLNFADLNREDLGPRFGSAIGRVDHPGHPDHRDQPKASDLRHYGSHGLAQAINRNVNPSWKRIANINRASLFPAWARPGWGALRPWDKGWYGSRSFTPWTWWGARSRDWGVTSLASRASINQAIDRAINNYIPYIVVPKTKYKLLYGTELPAGSESVSFVVQANSLDYRLNANCKSGTINAQQPTILEEAELLNAACQVAFGPV
jgi:hypothetical protein